MIPKELSAGTGIDQLKTDAPSGPTFAENVPTYFFQNTFLDNLIQTSLKCSLRISNIKDVKDSPLSAHVQQKYIEARFLLLHQFEDALHTQTVGRPVRVRCIHRHHETVPVVLISVTGVVQQAYRGNSVS